MRVVLLMRGRLHVAASLLAVLAALPGVACQLDKTHSERPLEPKGGDAVASSGIGILNESDSQKAVKLTTLVPKLAEKFGFKASLQCIPTWEGKKRTSSVSQVRWFPQRSSYQSHFLSRPYSIERVVLPGCADIGARRAAIYERPVPAVAFLDGEAIEGKFSPLIREMDRLWLKFSMLDDGPYPPVSDQVLLTHYVDRTLVSFTFVMDTNAAYPDTHLESHTLFAHSGTKVKFGDLFRISSKQKLLARLNRILSLQIEEKNRNPARDDDGPITEDMLFHQAASGSPRCEVTQECVPTRFFEEHLNDFILTESALVYYFDFGFAHGGQAGNPLSEVTLTYASLEKDFRPDGPFGDYGKRLNLAP